MKIAVIMGTRPEIIRLYHTVKALPKRTIYWTGQNFEKNLSEDIFNDPMLRDAYKDVIMLSTDRAESFCAQFGIMINELFLQLSKNRPDKVLILGDTNSSLAGALVAKKLGLPLYHMEAGNRCYDLNSPEEVNRKLIDSITDVHMCYTQHARQNLLSEGVPQNRIHVIGNPIAEFQQLHATVKAEDYVLVTCHRKENKQHLGEIISALKYLGEKIKIIACIHPRYLSKFRGHNNIDCKPSVPFSEFIQLQKKARVIVTDSGTVCEEAAMLGVPCVVIRETMERPELFDFGCCILSGASDSVNIVSAIESQWNHISDWDMPEEYYYAQVSKRVKNIVLSKGNYK